MFYLRFYSATVHSATSRQKTGWLLWRTAQMQWQGAMKVSNNSCIFSFACCFSYSISSHDPLHTDVQVFECSTLSFPSSKSTFSQPFKEKCMWGSEKIGSIINFHLSKLWKVKLSILCHVIFLVRPQGKFEFDHSWEWTRFTWITLTIFRQTVFTDEHLLSHLFNSSSWNQDEILVNPGLIGHPKTTE